MAYKKLVTTFYCGMVPGNCGYFNSDLKVCETDSTIGICPFHAPDGYVREWLKVVKFATVNPLDKGSL